MNDDKPKLDPSEWTETEPNVYQRRPFTASEIEKLSRRPDELIRSALGKPTK